MLYLRMKIIESTYKFNVINSHNPSRMIFSWNASSKGGWRRASAASKGLREKPHTSSPARPALGCPRDWIRAATGGAWRAHLYRELRDSELDPEGQWEQRWSLQWMVPTTWLISLIPRPKLSSRPKQEEAEQRNSLKGFQNIILLLLLLRHVWNNSKIRILFLKNE